MCAAPQVEAARAEIWGVTELIDVVDLAEEGWDTVARLEAWLDAGHGLAREWAPGVGIDPEACVRPRLKIIAGVHPHNAKHYDDAMEAALKAVLTDPHVVGIGEAGLDFFYDFSPREVQVEAFRRQIRLAHETGLPLCLHIRDAHDLALRVLEEEGFPRAGCVLHCFNLGPEVLAPWLEHDAFVGFDGPLTFASADEVRAAALTVPRERLLVETDAPYITPAPMRGMPCGPGHVVFNAAKLAEVLDADVRDLCSQLSENADRLYPFRKEMP
ncbi:MAG: TatD family hydrolase [Eggerthellaceae bacterium]|nr:TatD family hydrolase [Eggerthellaceae bacterium]